MLNDNGSEVRYWTILLGGFGIGEGGKEKEIRKNGNWETKTTIFAFDRSLRKIWQKQFWKGIYKCYSREKRNRISWFRLGR